MGELRGCAARGGRAMQVAEKAGILARFAARLRLQARGEFGEPPRLDGRPQLAHQLVVIVEVVQGIEPRAQYFVHALQVMKIGAREMATGVAAAVRVEGIEVGPVARVPQLYHAAPRVDPAVAGV